MRKTLIAILLVLGFTSAHAVDKRPVVVELFTSQGCNSCPPADDFLGELAARPDILALGLHVDYWDYIGWKDPYATHAHTERQRSYSRSLKQRYIYTPQMVIDGTFQGVGSDRGTINKLIDRAQRAAEGGPNIVISGSGALRVVHIGAGQPAMPATVWLVFYDSRHETSVRAGENSGRRLANYNVVRTMTPVGRWTGGATDFPVDLDASDANYDGAAIIVQSEGNGPIVSAMRVDRTNR